MEDRVVIGIDEVGRGSLAGPLVACAVAWPSKCELPVRDSKLLTRAAREALWPQICRSVSGVGIGWVGADRIDQIGLTGATRQAMAQALTQLSSIGEAVLIDGAFDYLAGIAPARTIVDGDQSEPSIAAASIVAKVLRDRFMKRLAIIFPSYGFERHVGYGTSFHRAALQEFGPCEIHRRSFLPLKAQP